MESSFKQLKQVPDQLLEERMKFVHKLSESDTEMYEIVKDKLNGEHYIHYAYMHLDIAGDGQKEWYHHFLPIENDDVLSLIFESPDYRYPDSWKIIYLRNGPDGHYIWFDPQHAEDFEESVKLGAQIKEILSEFKKEGHLDQEAVKKMMDELDQLRKGK